MAADSEIPTSFSSNSDILFNKESGLLDGVGNEVWIGILCIMFFLWFSKYIIDVYMFPESPIGNSSRASTTNNQGKILNIADLLNTTELLKLVFDI